MHFDSKPYHSSILVYTTQHASQPDHCQIQHYSLVWHTKKCTLGIYQFYGETYMYLVSKVQYSSPPSHWL